MEASWGRLGGFWGVLGGFLAFLGAFVGSSCRPLGMFLGLLGQRGGSQRKCEIGRRKSALRSVGLGPLRLTKMQL